VTVSILSPTTGLANNSTINFSVSTTGTATLSGAVVAHICAHNAGISNTSDFGYQGTFCVKQAGITTGSLGTGAANDYAVQTAPLSGVTTSGTVSIMAGEGTVNWITDLSALESLQCGPGNPCDLVIEANYNQSPFTSFFTQELDFASAPGQPTGLGATAGNTSAGLSWTAPASNGGSAITNYQVTVSPAPGSGPCSTGTCLTGSTGTTFNVTGLTNFTPYTFTVAAVNAIGTGPASTSASATPGPAGPTGLSGSPGNNQVALSWNPVTGATNYQVNVSPNPASGPCASGSCLTGSTNPSFVVTGLTNGTNYTFTVQAAIGANFTSPSAAIQVTPNADFVTQSISVTRPEGVLVISQYCSGLPTDANGNFDPSNSYSPTSPDNNFSPNPVPNTVCSLTLSGPRPANIYTDGITASGRTVQDAVTNGTTTITSASIGFVSPNDVNQLVTGTGIPAGTRIQSVTNATTAVLTNPASTTINEGDLTIVGSTVNFASPHGFAAGDVGKEIEGLQIPGGSTITNVVSASAVDISQPADNASTGLTVREWTVAPTPAKLITTGPHKGQYFEADGQLRQVMVVDTRTADTGWTATGQMSSFCDTVVTTQCFSGNDLGWTPQPIAASSAAFGSPDGAYSMSPANGASVTPGAPGLASSTSASTDTLVTGSVPGATLAYAQAGHGLGLAQLDAQLLLWLPVQDPAGHYAGTITLTAI
jgi:hypothetical protein